MTDSLQQAITNFGFSGKTEDWISLIEEIKDLKLRAQAAEQKLSIAREADEMALGMSLTINHLDDELKAERERSCQLLESAKEACELLDRIRDVIENPRSEEIRSYLERRIDAYRSSEGKKS